MTNQTIDHNSFDHELTKYTSDRKQVSDRLYHFLHVLVVVMALCSVAFAASYATQLGESLLFKVIISAAAVGVECSLIFFAAAMYPKPLLRVFACIAGAGVILVSIFTAMSFLLSQQYAADYKTVELRKAYASKLQGNFESMDIEDVRNRGSIGIISDRLERQLADLEGHQGSKATAIYHYAAHTLGYSVESVSFIIRFVWALVFVSVAIALASYLETIYSPSSLGKWINELKRKRAVLSQAREDFEGWGTPQPQPVVMHSSATPETSLDRYRRTAGEGEGISETTYQRIRKAVQSGAISPTVASLKKAARGTERAYQAIDRMVREGVINQQTNGRYVKA